MAAPVADRRGRFAKRFAPRRARPRYLLRARAADGRVSRTRRVRSRDLVLAAVGDVNLGDGPGAVMAQRGLAFPWTGVGPVLRRADIAFGNLECAVSARGAPVPKLYNFRGRPAALRVMARRAGFDVLNLANNHVGDYGRTALLDTVRHVRRERASRRWAPGGSLASASRPRVVRRLGLRVAFVGFSDILPAFSTPARAGPAPSRRRCRRSAPASGARGGGPTW